MDRVFRDRVGRNIEVYVDNTLVKLSQTKDLVGDLEETFSTLQRYGLKLNTSKCIFCVKSGKFLGYLVIERGIEANLEKAWALQEMRTQNTWEVQRLVGRIIALFHFISTCQEVPRKSTRVVQASGRRAPMDIFGSRRRSHQFCSSSLGRSNTVVDLYH